MSAHDPNLQLSAVPAPPGDRGVSVVIPFYNRSRFAERLFRSILAQTLKPVAVYIVDNGSASNELAACRRIAMSLEWAGSQPCFLQTEKKGNANVARNLGIETARTRYVAFVDSDDWWDPLHLESSLARLRSTDRAGVYAGAKVHLGGVHVNASRDVNACASPFELLFSGDSAQTSSYVIDLERLGQRARWDETLRRHQDFDFFLQVHYAGGGWAFLPTPYTHIDWEEGGAKAGADYRSMIRFRRKWEHLIPQGALLGYAYQQVLRCHELKSHALYKKYFTRLYLEAAGGAFAARVRTLGCYMALKGLLHRHNVVRRLGSAGRGVWGA